MKPVDDTLGRLRPGLLDRAAPGFPYVQGGTVVSIAIVVFGAVMFTFRPNLVSRVRLRLAWDRQSLLRLGWTLFLCTAFMFVGPLLMVLNKEILQTAHFDFPLTLSSLGLLTTAVIVRPLVAVGVCEVRPEARAAVTGAAWFRTVLPIALAKAATLACGNTVYLHLGIGFIQMLKALNPVIIVVVMRLCGLDLPSRMARWGVYLIISGTLLEVKGELNATLFGLFLMITSEVMEAINLVLSQKLLQNCKLTVVEGIYAIAPASGMFLCSAAALLEWPRMQREGRYMAFVDYRWHFVASSLLGLSVNFVGMAVVQATSSLTMKVLNTLRGIGVVFVGILFYGEHCTSLELCGYGVAIAGVCLYNFAQYKAEHK